MLEVSSLPACLSRVHKGAMYVVPLEEDMGPIQFPIPSIPIHDP